MMDKIDGDRWIMMMDYNDVDKKRQLSSIIILMLNKDAYIWSTIIWDIVE